jgi:N-acetylmuramoyl-L-alanine amidase
MDGQNAIPTPPQGESAQPPVVVINDTTRLGSAPAQRQKSSFTAWRALQSVFSMALLVATLFTLWTPDNLFSNDFMERMLVAMQPAAVEEEVLLPTPPPSSLPRIGLVAGHWGNDPGAVCADGLTEEQLNLRIATLVQDFLVKEGYEVDLLKEFDPRLIEYRALALVSIHNDSCDYINDQATGFKVAAASSSLYPERASRLTACLSQRYEAITGLSFHYNTVTNDMTRYHAFSEVHSDTTAAIIETGFMNLDREILTKQTDVVALGVANGILCYVRNEGVPRQPTPTPP